MVTDIKTNFVNFMSLNVKLYFQGREGLQQVSSCSRLNLIIYQVSPIYLFKFLQNWELPA